MRGVVSANASALRAAGDSLSRDEAQRLRHARAFYEKPPLGTVSEQDARFMTAAISAALGESSAARSAVRLAQRKGDSGPAIAALAAAYAPPPAPTVAPPAPSPATPAAPALALKDR